MSGRIERWSLPVLTLWGLGLLVLAGPLATQPAPIPAGREEVVFWHFWGGADRDVVERVIARFNARQERYQVRGIAMPGNNLDLKVFLAVAGGTPPDVINQDDPIVADWAARGALLPLEEVAAPHELAALSSWLVPAARRLGTYNDQLYALGNALDIRALYYNATILQELQLPPPQTLAELDQIAVRATARDPATGQMRFGYLPDPRRLWAWGVVFGGEFYDEDNQQVTANSPAIVAALEWMTTYRHRYGAATLAAYRQGDQSLPGKTFPLLAGRYVVVMDGQWRVRDLVAAQQAERAAGQTVTQYGVCPLPPPPGGRVQAGWVNGNFFVIPRGARCRTGAWEFMKFWSGVGGQEAEAAQTCAEGGWIPVSSAVIRHPRYRRLLAEQPLLRVFVELAESENQLPTPVIPGAPRFLREVNEAAATALYREPPVPPRELLDEATRRVQASLDRWRDTPRRPEDRHAH